MIDFSHQDEILFRNSNNPYLYLQCEMRVFNKPNKSNGWKCPICKKDDEKKVVLLGIIETLEDNIMEANQVHLDCIVDKIIGVEINDDSGKI